MKTLWVAILLTVSASAQLIGNGPPVGQCHVANFGQTIYYTDSVGKKNYYCDTMVTPNVWVQFLQTPALAWTPDPTIDWAKELPTTIAIQSMDADGVTIHCTLRSGAACKL